jgi:hypothetical protein
VDPYLDDRHVTVVTDPELDRVRRIGDLELARLGRDRGAEKRDACRPTGARGDRERRDAGRRS